MFATHENRMDELLKDLGCEDETIKKHASQFIKAPVNSIERVLATIRELKGEQPLLPLSTPAASATSVVTRTPDVTAPAQRSIFSIQRTSHVDGVTTPVRATRAPDKGTDDASEAAFSPQGVDWPTPQSVHGSMEIDIYEDEIVIPDCMEDDEDSLDTGSHDSESYWSDSSDGSDDDGNEASRDDPFTAYLDTSACVALDFSDEVLDASLDASMANAASPNAPSMASQDVSRDIPVDNTEYLDMSRDTTNIDSLDSSREEANVDSFDVLNATTKMVDTASPNAPVSREMPYARATSVSFDETNGRGVFRTPPRPSLSFDETNGRGVFRTPPRASVSFDESNARSLQRASASFDESNARGPWVRAPDVSFSFDESNARGPWVRAPDVSASFDEPNANGPDIRAPVRVSASFDEPNARSSNLPVPNESVKYTFSRQGCEDTIRSFCRELDYNPGALRENFEFRSTVRHVVSEFRERPDFPGWHSLFLCRDKTMIFCSTPVEDSCEFFCFLSRQANARTVFKCDNCLKGHVNMQRRQSTARAGKARGLDHSKASSSCAYNKNTPRTFIRRTRRIKMRQKGAKKKINRLLDLLRQKEEMIVNMRSSKNMVKVLKEALAHCCRPEQATELRQEVVKTLLASHKAYTGHETKETEEELGAYATQIVHTFGNYSKRLAGKPRQCRFSSTVIRTALAMWLKSPSNYESMRKHGIEVLPSARTLYNVQKNMVTKEGNCPKIYSWFRDGRKHLSDFEFRGTILFDEMTLKTDLYSNVMNNKTYGFAASDGEFADRIDLSAELTKLYNETTSTHESQMAEPAPPEEPLTTDSPPQEESQTAIPESFQEELPMAEPSSPKELPLAQSSSPVSQPLTARQKLAANRAAKKAEAAAAKKAATAAKRVETAAKRAEAAAAKRAAAAAKKAEAAAKKAEAAAAKRATKPNAAKRSKEDPDFCFQPAKKVNLFRFRDQAGETANLEYWFNSGSLTGSTTLLQLLQVIHHCELIGVPIYQICADSGGSNASLYNALREKSSKDIVGSVDWLDEKVCSFRNPCDQSAYTREGMPWFLSGP